MSKWLLIALLGLEVHFAASYLVPLDAPSQSEFGGLLPWFWPWAYGDAGPFGQIAVGTALPMTGFYLAMTAASALALAALAVGGLWVPAQWWRPLAVAGAAALACLMALFFGHTKLIPLAASVLTLYVAMLRPTAFEAS